MKLKNILPVIVAVFALVSCGTLQKSEPFAVKTNLEMKMSDMVFLGESEISCQYDTYLGFIRHYNYINGEVYQPGQKSKLNIPHSGISNKGMELAAAKMLAKYPEARFFQVVMETKNTDVLFLGGTTTRTAKLRAYSFRDKPFVPQVQVNCNCKGK